jgi:hypothetical protein
MSDETVLEEWMYEDVDPVWYQAEYALFWEDDGYTWTGLSVLVVHETAYDPDMQHEISGDENQ